MRPDSVFGRKTPGTFAELLKSTQAKYKTLGDCEVGRSNTMDDPRPWFNLAPAQRTQPSILREDNALVAPLLTFKRMRK